MEPLSSRSHFVCRNCIATSLKLHPRRTVVASASRGARYVDNSETTRPRRWANSAPTLASRIASRTAGSNKLGEKSHTKPAEKTTAKNTSKNANQKSFWENEWTVFSADNAALVKKAQAFGDKVLHAKGIPEDSTVLEAMQVIEFAAAQLTRKHAQSERTKTLQEQLESKGKTKIHHEEDHSHNHDGLLSLDPSALKDASDPAHPVSISISTDLLSSLAYKILTHPSVFITPEILLSYVHTQSSLRRPSTIPEAFNLYASKPVPASSATASTSTLRYKQPNPDSHKQAIPAACADAALAAAIDTKDLDLAITVIDASYATKAFQRNKFIVKAFPAIGGIALTPLAAGIIASQLPAFFPIANPAELVTYATAGMVSYVAGISTLGFVVVTTTNDHMERVTWAPGVALRMRWMREEERAAVDKVAIAWGFANGRQGEEQGEQWEALREWCGLRGMILDKTELMEGME